MVSGFSTAPPRLDHDGSVVNSLLLGEWDLGTKVTAVKETLDTR